MPVCPERQPGHYWVQVTGPVIHLYLAYWTGEHFLVPGSPTRFRPEQFGWIGPRVEDQLIAVQEAVDAPHYGSNDTQLDNYFDACDPIRDFVREVNLT